MPNSESQWIELYADGSCLRSGIGACAFLLRFRGKEKLGGIAYINSTNNQMEMLGIIRGLQALTQKGLNITIYTDSQYVLKGITEYYDTWEKRNFKTTSGKELKNVSLWKQLKELSDEHNCIWNWLKAHNGNPYHDRVDEEARRLANNFNITQ